MVIPGAEPLETFEPSGRETEKNLGDSFFIAAAIFLVFFSTGVLIGSDGWRLDPLGRKVYGKKSSERPVQPILRDLPAPLTAHRHFKLRPLGSEA